MSCWYVGWVGWVFVTLNIAVEKTRPRGVNRAFEGKGKISALTPRGVNIRRSQPIERYKSKGSVPYRGGYLGCVGYFSVLSEP